MKQPTVTGLILAGGRGARLGGRDKGLEPWHGRPLAAWTLERLEPQVTRVIISANRNLDTYRAFGHPVVTDIIPDHAGPLAGLQAGLAACTTPLLAAVPCDAPALPKDLVTLLQGALEDGAAAAAVAQVSGRLQPTFLLCRREAMESLGTFLAAGGRRCQDWLTEIGAISVPFAAGDFLNLNTPEDFSIKISP